MGKYLSSKKKVLIVFLIVVIMALISYNFLFKAKQEKKASKPALNNEDVIPTIDDSVKIDLTKDATGYEVVLSIENIPKKTDKIDYELSYQTEGQGLQGVLGPIDMEKVKNNKYNKTITLGTCSSGRCVYHKVVGNIKLMLKFNGQYGERVFEKEYEL